MKNSIITLSDFPVGYYAGGDHTTHCETIVDDINHALNFCEDATFWDLFSGAGKLEERRVILGCDPGRKEWNTVMGPLNNPDPHGSLWLYTPGESSQSKPKSKPQRLTLEGYPNGHDFHPLGLEIYPSHAGNASNLFVVNHARERTVIEQFSLSPSAPAQAQWVRTLTSDYFVSPNAIALTSPTSFYVTNDHLMTRRLPAPFGQVLPMVETLLGLPLGWLLHVSLEPNATSPDSPPTVHHTFASLGIPFANGVALSPDGKQVAVAASSISVVYFYDRTIETNELKHTRTVPMPFSPDNIMFDDEGALIVAGHPHFPSLSALGEGQPDAIAPSWVLSITPSVPLNPEVDAPFKPYKKYDTQAPISSSAKIPAIATHEIETLYQSNGKGFSSSSTGLRDSTTGVLYVTGLYEEGLLVCTP